jgi:hypothetical protein
MTTVWLCIAALILAISATTYALTRLAPTGAPPPRGAVAVIRVMRWFAEGDNAIGVTFVTCIAAVLCFAVWAFITYTLITTTIAAIITAVSGIALIKSARRRPADR